MAESRRTDRGRRRSALDVHLAGFHDAGWTSVVGVGRDQRDRLVVLKALPEAGRYQQERAALDHWAAENVLFDQARYAVFIDPDAKVGSPAFDWAFWCVYYVPTAGFAERVTLCSEQVPTMFDEVLAWSATLAVDGALYYLETGDDTASSMLAIINSPILADA